MCMHVYVYAYVCMCVHVYVCVCMCVDFPLTPRYFPQGSTTLKTAANDTLTLVQDPRMR